MSVLETVAEQIQVNGKMIGTYQFQNVDFHSEAYAMDETTVGYILFDGFGKVREVQFYNR